MRAEKSPPLQTATDVQDVLTRLADPARVPELQRFFKTGRGQYAEGDQFRGLKVPQIRSVVQQAASLPRPELEELLASPWHEDRLTGLLVAVWRFQRADTGERRALFRFYLAQARAGRINNWDLVDATAEHIVGGWLHDRPERAHTLDRLARSPSLWKRRIAVLATLHFIRRGECTDTLRLATMLLDEPHDLIHKALGWMLREVGKRNRSALDDFLASHAVRMPRTMLRYAIEKHSANERRRWMSARKVP